MKKIISIVSSAGITFFESFPYNFFSFLNFVNNCKNNFF